MASVLGRVLLLRSLRRPSFFENCSLAFNRRISSDHQHSRPLMLMDLPHVVYPNVFLLIKNFISRVIITGSLDSTFGIKSFSQGARQALTIVSQLIANNQFDDLPGFVTQEVINEVKQNYEKLSPQQRLQIAVEEQDIAFGFPHSINLITNEQTNGPMVEILMIFHVLKNPETYGQEMFDKSDDSTPKFKSTLLKIRDNTIVCNYRFQRDMSKNAQDDSWIITGLNHWLPTEYIRQY